jgi:hypothetical protein
MAASQNRRALGTRRLDRLRSRLHIFRGGVDGKFFETRNDAPEPAGAGPIESAFYRHQGRVVHKWHHYLPLYDRYFAPFRNRPIRFLEIGVAEGGSLELWRGFFGPQAVIFGIDLNPACAAIDGEHGNHVRIGSQADPEFLRATVAEMGGVDVVLDDGSHFAAHIRASFDVLFPLLAANGLYMIEDLHTAYWANFGGNYHSPGSAIGLLKSLIDDMHHWYHPHGQSVASARDWVGGIHVHDSLAVIEKRDVGRQPDKSFRGTRALV